MKHRRVIIIRFTSQIKMANQTQFLSLSTSRTTQAMIPLTIHQCSLTVTARRAPSQKTCREVQTISATDSDNRLRYSLSGTDAGSFSINSSTGQLSSSTQFDYETKNSYEVTVTVSDGREGTDSISVRSLSQTTQVTIPLLTTHLCLMMATRRLFLSPKIQQYTEIVRLPVTDPDNDIVGALMFGNPWARAGDFTIDSIRTETNQYVVVIKNTVTLDYETQTSYHYTVYVSDENGDSDSISVTINITNDPSDDTPNNPPMFTDGDSTTRSIAENMPGGTEVGSAISATDSDSDDTLTYRLDVTGDINSFSINSSTGQLSSSTQFDYETKNSYEVTVTVSDGREGTDSISVSISVTNDPSDDITPNSAPTFTDGGSTTRSIAENMPGGTEVGSAISATDSDNSDTLRYSLSGTDAGSFSINSSTGQLSTSTQFDYETKNSYEVTVTVSDGRGGTDSISVSISVTNDPSDDIRLTVPRRLLTVAVQHVPSQKTCREVQKSAPQYPRQILIATTP